MEKSGHKTNGETAFFAKEDESGHEDLDGDLSSKLCKKSNKPAKKSLKSSQILKNS
jgi:hypothetical protein